MEEGNKLNFKENCLNFQLSELGEVVETVKEFKKYAELWETSEVKWKYKSERWLESVLEGLDVIDMEDTINICLTTLTRLKT